MYVDMMCERMSLLQSFELEGGNAPSISTLLTWCILHVYNTPPRYKLLNHSGRYAICIVSIYIASVFFIISCARLKHNYSRSFTILLERLHVLKRKKRNRDTQKCTIYDEFTYIYYSSPAFHSTFPHFPSFHYLYTYITHHTKPSRVRLPT